MNQEKNILEGLLRGKGDAQRLLLQQYGARVFAQIVRVVPRQEDAEEVYQDVFIKAFRSIESFDPGRASLSTWLLKIAYHESLNFMRKRKYPILYLEDSVGGMENLTSDEVDELLGRTDEDTVNLIEQALEQLNAIEQSLVSMFYFEDLSIKEIAYVMESVPSTIASRLCRIRQKLYHLIIDSKHERKK